MSAEITWQRAFLAELSRCDPNHFDIEPTPELLASLSKAVERARVVAVLDAWALKSGHAVFTRHTAGSGWRTESIRQRLAGDAFHGTADAARAAAAKAIEAGEV